MSEETYLEYYANKYKPEILCISCVTFGSYIIATVGLNVFNNRYISIPYIIFISVMYIIYRSQENAKRRNSTN